MHAGNAQLSMVLVVLAESASADSNHVSIMRRTPSCGPRCKLLLFEGRHCVLQPWQKLQPTWHLLGWSTCLVLNLAQSMGLLRNRVQGSGFSVASSSHQAPGQGWTCSS